MTGHQEAESRRDQDTRTSKRGPGPPQGLWERSGGAGASTPPGPGLSAPIGGAPARFLPPPLRREPHFLGEAGQPQAPAGSVRPRSQARPRRLPALAARGFRVLAAASAPPGLAAPPAASPARPHPLGTRLASPQSQRLQMGGSVNSPPLLCVAAGAFGTPSPLTEEHGPFPNVRPQPLPFPKPAFR